MGVFQEPTKRTERAAVRTLPVDSAAREPHRFSSMQVLQIWKPQEQVQQKGCSFPQQLHR